MSKNKSPRLDGMTMKILTACWDFLSQDCIDMITHFWSTRVMKVIPKKTDKHHLKNWRPLTMLTIIYKLIASLLSTRLSPVSCILISPQQTRFIPGRSILENISLALMVVEWVTKNKIPTLLILLDSENAFDQVEHKYIWAILEKIGLGGTFLMLVKALLTNVVSKVHVNSRFMDEIPLTRGVCQGCPLSPLPSALCPIHTTTHGLHLTQTKHWRPRRN